jgi:hypothetical protein
MGHAFAPDLIEKAHDKLEPTKSASLASRKFDFEDMINADPKCPIAALKIVRAYLRFITNFDDGSAYVSIIDLQVATGLSTRAIIDNRNALVSLGYFEPDGKTRTGALRYKMKFTRENMVLDHVIIAREVLRRVDAERKERQRLKRMCSAVIEPNAGRKMTRACNEFRDVIEPNAGDYLEEYPDILCTERKDICEAISTNGYVAARSNDLHIPFPSPSSERELVETFSILFADCQLGPLAMNRMRKLLSEGKLTPAIVKGQRGRAA